MNRIPLSTTAPSLNPARRWVNFLLYGWILLVLLPLPFLGVAVQTTSLHFAADTHAAVEMFCGATALLIAGLILSLAQRYRERALMIAALGFLVMGGLDVSHALSDPIVHPGWFVASHTLSALSGSVLLWLSATGYYWTHMSAAPAEHRHRPLLFALVALGVIGMSYQLLLPAGGSDEYYAFSMLARRAHEVSWLLYAVAGVFAVLLYRATRNPMAAVVAAMLFLFAQGAYLFRLCDVWDLVWWSWHAVKVVFYVTILVVIAARLVMALGAAERAYEDLQFSSARLRIAEAQRARAKRLTMLGRMTASLAHEIHNPLSAINNCLGVLQRSTRGQPRAEQALRIVADEVRHLERLTNNMICFGQPQRKGTLSRVRAQALAQQVRDGIVAHIANEKLAITVRLDVPESLPEIWFDASGLRQVLWNLLLNAVQATQGSGRVEVRMRQHARTLFLAVVDVGPGVPAADRARILAPFFTQRSQGAGLGLAVVRHHVDAWGGQLRIWGPPGACFALRVPVPTQPVVAAVIGIGEEIVS
ncbi:MAG: ATP-binding protein [Sinobacteraceae bacterium]|nr:ATP-binding protein [Nevskiaceae bacterium]